MNLPFSILALALAIVTCHSATYYASPTGTDGAAGTLADPVSLKRAIGDGLTSPAGPGDTIYLRGGSYIGGFNSYLAGTVGNPITVTPYLSERAFIESQTYDVTCLYIQSSGSDTIYQGIEFWNSNTTRTFSDVRGTGLMIFAPRTKIINCIVHDTGVGIGLWDDATPSEINGCLIYNCGYDKPGDLRGHGHGIYSHARTGGHQLRGNVIINPYDNGIQCYGDSGLGFQLCDYIIEGNCAIHGPDILSSTGVRGANYYLGGSGVLMTNLNCFRNYGFHPSGTSDNATFGDPGTENANCSVISNYWSGGSFTVNQWTNIVFSKNTMVNPGTYLHYTPSAHVVSVSWNNNIYQSGFAWPFQLSGVAKTWVEWKSDTSFDAASTLTTSSLTTTNIFVRANDYAPTSGYIAIYNYGLKDNVSVDLSSIVSSGYTYTVRDAANYATVVKTGTYAGGFVTLPMTNLPPATPVGLSTPAASGPAFNAFLVTQGSRTGPLLRVTNLVIRNP